MEHQVKLAKGQQLFDSLPSEVRKEFGQSPQEFFDYVNDPENADRLGKLIPDLAKPGRQNIDVSGAKPPLEQSEEPVVAPKPAADAAAPAGSSDAATVPST